MLDQLDRKGITGEYFLDLVDDYLKLRKIKMDLLADIRKRGVSVRWQNGEYSFGWKRNESISELVKTHSQMLRILNQLGLSASKMEKSLDPEDEEM